MSWGGAMKRFILICFAGVSLAILPVVRFTASAPDAKHIRLPLIKQFVFVKTVRCSAVKSIELKDIIETAPVVVDFKRFQRAIGSSGEQLKKE